MGKIQFLYFDTISYAKVSTESELSVEFKDH